jgi:hypothetical protein
MKLLIPEFQRRLNIGHRSPVSSMSSVREPNLEKPKPPNVPEIMPWSVVSTLPTMVIIETDACAPSKRCSNV